LFASCADLARYTLLAGFAFDGFTGVTLFAGYALFTASADLTWRTSLT
jgi:hypothetical protein